MNAGAFEQGHRGHFIASDRRSGRADLKFLSDTRWDGHPESVPGWLTPIPWTCVRRTLDLVKHIHTLPPYCPYRLPQLFGSSLCAEGAETKKRMSDIIREERDGENAYISEIPAARRPG